MDGKEKEDISKPDTGKPDTGKPDPPRWVMIYMLVLALGLIVWIILAVLHGGPLMVHSGIATGDRGLPRMTGRAVADIGRRRSAGIRDLERRVAGGVAAERAIEPDEPTDDQKWWVERRAEQHPVV